MTDSATTQTSASQQPASTVPAPSPEKSGLYSGMIGAAGGLASGVIVAGLNFIFTRRKMAAEIASLEALAEKTRLESEKLRNEMGRAVGAIPTVIAHALATESEAALYSSADRNLGHDFKVRQNNEWKKLDDKYVACGDKGEGSVVFDTPGTIDIRRVNVEGRIELTLQSYVISGKEFSQIPSDSFLDGPRKLRLSFDAKATGSEHTLRFVFKDERADVWLASTEQWITDTAWNTFSLYFQLSSTQESRLRIDDIQVQSVPSSVQLRNIVLAEKPRSGKK